MSFLPDKPRQPRTQQLRKYAQGGLVKIAPENVIMTRVMGAGADAPVKFYEKAVKQADEALKKMKPKTKKLKNGGVVLPDQMIKSVTKQIINKMKARK
jgi:hypothetical protein